MSHGWLVRGPSISSNAITTGSSQGPRMQVAGPGMASASPTAARVFHSWIASRFQPLGQRVGEDGRRAFARRVDEQARGGVNWIKIYSTQSVPLESRTARSMSRRRSRLEETQGHRPTKRTAKGLKVACHAVWRRRAPQTALPAGRGTCRRNALDLGRCVAEAAGGTKHLPLDGDDVSI